MSAEDWSNNYSSLYILFSVPCEGVEKRWDPSNQLLITQC